MTSPTERAFAAAGLSQVAASGVRGVLGLLGPHDCEEIWRADRSTLASWVGRRAWVDRYLAMREHLDPGSLLAAAEASGVSFIPYGHAHYAEGLRHLRYPPAGLFVVGSKEATAAVASRPRVTIVGTRKATRYGATVARMLGQNFSARGVAVLSGLALGIDGHVHRGALEGGGVTGAILGCGPDVVYPRRHADLYRRVTGEGVVLSEYAPGTPPTAWSFPERNRLLAAMGDAVVVVEAPSRSGALITAHCALDLGKDVFAVPGPIVGGESAGCNRLLYDGAFPCLDAEQVVEDFFQVTRMEIPGYEVAIHVPSGPEAADRPAGPETLVEGILASGPEDAEGVARAAGLEVREASVMLAMLELAGKVKRSSSGRYRVA